MNGEHEPLRQYETVTSLGAGGMADVYLAVARGGQGFRKLVVIKKIRAPLSDDPELLRMFEQEARLAARLNHPNIVQTLNFGVHDGGHAIVMEYLEGQALRTIARKAGPGGIPLTYSLEILIAVLAALDHAHQLKDFDGEPLNVVHRDVSPHNVFITYAGHTKLVDFGVAKALPDPYVTTGTLVKGKLSYMSPEHERGDPVDARADLFAVGVMLWEALVGHSLWAGLSEIAIVSRLRFGELPTPREASSDVPVSLDRLCMRALAHRREDRFQSAAEFRHELQSCVANLGLQSSTDEIGAFVSRLFEQERAQLREIVKARLTDEPGMNDVPPPKKPRPLAKTKDESGSSARPATLADRRPPLHRSGLAWGLASLLVIVGGIVGVAVSSRLGDPFSERGAPMEEAAQVGPPTSHEVTATILEVPSAAPIASHPEQLADSTEESRGTNAPPTTSTARATLPVAAAPRRTHPTVDPPSSSALAAATESDAVPTPTPTGGRVRFEDPWAPKDAGDTTPLRSEGQP